MAWQVAATATVLLASLLLSTGEAGPVPPPNTLLSTDGTNFFLQAALFGPAQPSFGSPARGNLHWAGPGCGVEQFRNATSTGFIAVVERGQCSFAAKNAAATQAGAAAIVVTNSIEGVYAAAMALNQSAFARINASSAYVGACDTECSRGTRQVQVSAVARSEIFRGLPTLCPCGACVFASAADVHQPTRQVCCAADDYLLMRGNASADGVALVPAAFARLSQRGAIRAAATDGRAGKVSWRSVYALGPTTVFMWLLGVLVTAWATWYSAKQHREQLALHLAAPLAAKEQTTTPQPQQQESTIIAHNESYVHVGPSPALSNPSVSDEAQASNSGGDAGAPAGQYKGQCSVGLVAGALVLSSVLLLVLFFMLRGGVPIVWLLIPLFALGAAAAQARIVWLPLLRKLQWPALGKHAGWLHEKLKHLTVRIGIAAALGAAVSGIWIALRHTPAVFLFQNLLGALVCANLLVRLQLHELRAISALLAAFFVYDVFFVFLTPFVFGGDSVMVAVATAGQPEPVSNPACFCRLNPGADACGEGERMPILLTLPRMGWGGGEALLGLGDIVLPGLLLSLLARYDTEGFHGLWKGKYWLCGMAGYALGLAGANAAVVVSGQGQPALLYIVPCVVAATLLRAWYLKEVPLVWYGPIGTVPDAESVRLIASSSTEAAPAAARAASRSVQHDTVNPMVGRGDAAESGVQLTEAGHMDPVQGSSTTRGRRQRPGDVETARLLP